jgi:hypothetical protein
MKMWKRENKRNKTKCNRDPHVTQRAIKRDGFSNRLEPPTPAPTST